MHYILIPIKDLTLAKQRLGNVLTLEERTHLAWAMLVNTFEAVACAKQADRVAIVTMYEPAIKLANGFDFEIVREENQVSESESVDYGSRQLIERGAVSVLRIPIDLPLISAEDIDTILERENAAVIVPSLDGTGTNALLRRPPDLFPSQFGPDSLSKHVAEAEDAGIDYDIMQIPNLALDIDEPGDLRTLIDTYSESKICQLLMDLGIKDRLNSRESFIPKRETIKKRR